MKTRAAGLLAVVLGVAIGAGVVVPDLLSTTGDVIAVETPRAVADTEVIASVHARSGWRIETTVDGAAVEPVFANPSGRTSVVVPLVAVGFHHVRFAAYDESGTLRADETRDIYRQADPPPAPQVVSVEPLAGSDEVRVIGLAEPYARLQVFGARVSPAPATAGYAGTFDVRLTPLDDGWREVTFRAINESGVRSTASQPLDPADPSRFEASPGASAKPDVRLTYNVSLRRLVLDGDVTLPAAHPDLRWLIEGRMGAPEFLRRMAGYAEIGAGRAETRHDRCEGELGDDFGDLQHSFTVAEHGQVRVSQALDYGVARIGGYADDPVFRVCFPDGFPAAAHNGEVAISVTDYDVINVTPAPDRIEQSGAATRYVWNDVPRRGSLVVHFAADRLAHAALLPHLDLRDIVGGLSSGVWYAVTVLTFAFIRTFPVLWLAWAVTRGFLRGVITERSTTRHLLAFAIALALVPTASHLSYPLADLGVWQLGQIDVVEETWNTSGQPAIAGVPVHLHQGLRVAAMLAMFLLAYATAAVVGRGNENRRRPLLRLALEAVCIALALQVLISLCGVVLLAVLQWGDPGAATRAVSWVATTGLAVGAAWYALRLTRNASPGSVSRRRQAPATWWWLLAAATILAAVPAYDFPGLDARDTLAAYYSTLDEFGWQIAYSFWPLSLVLIFAIVRRNANVRWERLGPTSLIDGLGRLLFAGYAVGNVLVIAGVFPASVVVAALLYRFLVKPASEIRLLRDEAPELRRTRADLIEESLAKTAAPAPILARRDLVLAIGPGKTVWRTVWFAGSVSLALGALLAIPYLVGLDAGRTSGAFPWARLGVLVAVFLTRWLALGLLFGLTYEHLRGNTGLTKGLWLGVVVVALTLAFSLLNAIGGVVDLRALGLELIQLLAFCVALGAACDVFALRRAGRRMSITSVRTVVRELGHLSGFQQAATSVGAIVTAVGAVVLSLITGQLGQLVTALLSPFLPIQPPPGPE